MSETMVETCVLTLGELVDRKLQNDKKLEKISVKPFASILFAEKIKRISNISLQSLIINALMCGIRSE